MTSAGPRRFDCLVLGVGGMGSAAVYHLARRGQRVLGLEQFGIPHDRGSSHGLTRIIRLAYYEHPSYVPLLRRAYALWRELQAQAGQQLLHITGSIDAGPPDSQIFAGSLASCRLHGLPHEVLDGAEVRHRFPGYQLPPDLPAVFQPDGGFLQPEACITAHVQAARALGADVHEHEPVRRWAVHPDGVEVHTDQGRYQADRLLVCAGAWLGGLLPQLAPLAVPERQVMAWLEPLRPELFQPERFPVFNLLVDEGRYYGFPSFRDEGFKIGRYHHLAQQADPDTLDRTITAQDEAILRVCVERYFPQAAGRGQDHKVCMFTNTPDEHFLLDRLAGNITIAGGFSGHGFKFCSVVGEVLADLALTGSTAHDISLFRLDRFDAAAATARPGSG